MNDRNDDPTGAATLLAMPSLSAAIRRFVMHTPDQPAVGMVADPGTAGSAVEWTYAELDERARTVAAALRERCQPGSRALLLYPMGLEFVAAFVGCLYAEIIAVPVPLPGRRRHHQQRLSVVAESAGIGVALTELSSLEALREWAEQALPAGVELLATDQAGLADPHGGEPGPANWQTIAMLQYTSGSTRSPKGVVLDHGNLLSNVASFVRTAGLPADARSGGWIPLFHDMGLSCQLLSSLLRGSTCYLMDPQTFALRPETWLTLIDDYDVAVSLAPNFAYELCNRRIRDERLATLDLSRWSFAGNGSEPIKPAVMATFAERFATTGFREQACAPSYGLAEATVFVSTQGVGRPPVVYDADAQALEAGMLRPGRPRETNRQLVGCGPIGDGFDVEIVDPATREPVPVGAVGEVWLRGPSVARGYWNDPAATEQVFAARTMAGADGYLRTGDLGILDADGQLIICGRIKDMVIVHGRNIYPHDIEHELRMQHPELGNVGAVFAVPSPDGMADDRLIVTHEVSALGDEQLVELTSAIGRTVSREFGIVPAEVLLLRSGAVARTTSGKVQRTAMRELHLAGQLRTRPGRRSERPAQRA